MHFRSSSSHLPLPSPAAGMMHKFLKKTADSWQEPEWQRGPLLQILGFVCRLLIVASDPRGAERQPSHTPLEKAPPPPAEIISRGFFSPSVLVLLLSPFWEPKGKGWDMTKQLCTGGKLESSHLIRGSDLPRQTYSLEHEFQSDLGFSPKDASPVPRAAYPTAQAGRASQYLPAKRPKLSSDF